MTSTDRFIPGCLYRKHNAGGVMFIVSSVGNIEQYTSITIYRLYSDFSQIVHFTTINIEYQYDEDWLKAWERVV